MKTENENANQTPHCAYTISIFLLEVKILYVHMISTCFFNYFRNSTLTYDFTRKRKKKLKLYFNIRFHSS